MPHLLHLLALASASKKWMDAGSPPCSPHTPTSRDLFAARPDSTAIFTSAPTPALDLGTQPALVRPGPPASGQHHVETRAASNDNTRAPPGLVCRHRLCRPFFQIKTGGPAPGVCMMLYIYHISNNVTDELSHETRRPAHSPAQHTVTVTVTVTPHTDTPPAQSYTPAGHPPRPAPPRRVQGLEGV